MEKSNKFTYKFLATFIIILSTFSFLASAKESKVLSVVTGDWNHDNRVDAAVLMNNNNSVEIYIFLADKKNNLKTVLYKKSNIWMGSMHGTKPYLERREKSNSLLIVSGNDSIGRNRWLQTLTVAYRKKEFMVGGYTYESRDTLKPDSAYSCDVNLFTGKGLSDNKKFKMIAQNIKLKDWSGKYAPKECREE